MTRNGIVAAVVGALVAGVGLGFGVSDCRHRSGSTPPAADRQETRGLAAEPAPNAPGAELATLRQSNEILRHRVGLLEQQLASGRSAAAVEAELGKSAGDAFEAETRDPAWATSRESQIQDRLGRYLGIRPISVECRSSCCRVHMRNDDMAGHEGDLQSDVGLSGRWNWRDHGYATDDKPAYMIVCDEYDPADYPDRAIERDAILRAAQPALARCGPVDQPLILRIALEVDEQGAVEDVDSRADPLGHPAAECAERAILSAAAFAPSRRGTRVPVIVKLPP